MQEVQKVMNHAPKFTPHVMTRKSKGKTKASSLTFTAPAGPSHKKGLKKSVSICKNVIVFKYMGPDISEFTHSDKDIVLTGMLNFELDSESEEIVDDICALIRCSKSHDYSSVSENDFEFIKCTGKVCRVSETPENFQWTGRAIKHLCGQGDLYVRLKSPACQSPPKKKSASVVASDDIIFIGDEVQSSTCISSPHTSNNTCPSEAASPVNPFKFTPRSCSRMSPISPCTVEQSSISSQSLFAPSTSRTR